MSLTLTELVDSIESGRLTSLELIESCLSWIDISDPELHAWVMIDRDGAVTRARKSDARRSENRPLSRLDGIPVGVKDIIDVAGWPTVAGFKPWRDKIATNDAWIVAKMRQAGLIPLGKTVTTQFASIDPPPTLNPWDVESTPGGSSSGSCASVASGMVPLALGSQTGGSINRPASFCGVVGLKLTYSEWPTDGVVPCSPSLDTLGPITCNVKDLKLVLAVLPGIFDSPAHRELFQKGLNHDPDRPLRILRLGGRFQSLASQEMQNAMDLAVDRLNQAGCLVEFDENATFFDDDLWRIHRTIMMAECFITHETLFAEYPDDYSPKIRGWVETGREIPESDYHDAQLQRGVKLAEFTRIFGHYDAVLTPAALGEAPGLETTGDPVFNSPWTLLGVPSLTVPVTLSETEMPLGVQLASTQIGGEHFGRLINAGIRLEEQNPRNDFY